MFPECPSTCQRRPSNLVYMDSRKKKQKRKRSRSDSASITQHNTVSRNETVVSNAGQCLKDNITPERAGVILYTVYNNQLYIGLAVDSASHDLTDFGGRIYYDNDPDCITGSLREFHEESLNIFNHIRVEDVVNYTVIYDNYNLVMFLHVDVDPDEASKKFLLAHNLQVTSRSNSAQKAIEVCGITWMSVTSFLDSVNTSGIIYERVRKLLAQVPDWHQVF